MAKVVEELQVLIKQHGAKEVSRAMKGLEKQTDKATSSLTKMAAQYVSMAAILGGTKGIISLYAQQERAERRLVQVSGIHAQTLINQAKAWQQVSIYGDEAIIQAQVLLKNFGATDEMMSMATDATVELAAAFGWDLTQAARNAGKTLGGFAGELGEAIPALKELTKEELQAGKGLELLIKLYGGQAAAETDTLYGSMQQAKNAAGDLGETIGGLLAPTVTKAAKAVTALIGELQRMNQFDWLAMIQSATGQGVLAQASERQAATIRTNAMIQKQAQEQARSNLGLDIPLVGPGQKKTKPKGKGGTDDLAAALAGGEDWGGSDAALAAWRDLEYGKLEIDEEVQEARTELWFQSAIDRLDNDQWALDQQVEAFKKAEAEKAKEAERWDRHRQTLISGAGQAWGQLWTDMVTDQKNAMRNLLANMLGVIGDRMIAVGIEGLLGAKALAFPTSGASLSGIAPSLALIAAGGILKGGQALTASSANAGSGSFSGGGFVGTASQERQSVEITVNYSGLGYDKGAIGAEIHDALGRAEKEGRI